MVTSQQTFKIFYILLKLLFIANLVEGECDYVNQRRIIPNFEYATKFKISKNMWSDNQNIGFGFWMRYLPYSINSRDIKINNDEQRHFFSITQSNENLLIKNQEEGFICSLIDNISNETLLIHQQKILVQEQRFDHEIFLNFLKEKGNVTFSFDKYKYEGTWMMFYIFIDVFHGTTMIGFWQLSKMKWYVKQINDYPRHSDTIILLIEQQNYNVIFKEKLFSFKNYMGQFTYVFQTGSNNIYETGIESCLNKINNINQCYEQIYYIISETEQFNGDKIQYGKVSNADVEKFIFYGWVKLVILKNEIYRESVIFRITINQNYNDELYYGDKFLYLKYYQNKILTLNGFLITTYSYDFPYRNNYNPQSNDSIESFNIIFYELFTQWHVIQYEKGTQNNNGFPFFRIFSPTFGEFQYHWQEDKNYFTYPTLYISLGGDKYSNTYLKGSLSQFNYEILCTEQPQEMKVLCHYSCQTCNGPTSTSCLSCSDYHNREYNQITKSCPCKQQFYDIYEYQVCDSLMDFQSSVVKVEQQLQFLHNYQYIINKQKYCLLGYILINDLCIQCPYYDNFNKRLQILCADCYLYPEQFKQQMKCTFDLISFNQQKENKFQKIQRNQQNIEFYELDYQQKFIITHCIERYYLINNQCLSCQNGCLQCFDQYTCLYCQQDYQLNNNYQCETIKNCIIFNKQQQNSVLKCDKCIDSYYLFNNSCIECGDYCQNCNNFRICNYCKDQLNYYITFDGINCKKCSLDNCYYCFQFYQSNNIIYTTLDINFYIQNLENIDIYEGCAKCYDNYFFNFITLKCELKYSQISHCSFGIIDNIGINECIIGDQTENSLQNKNCNQYLNCKECLNQKIFNFQQNLCVLCNDGYYFDFTYQNCQACIEYCNICYQQDTYQKDYWRQHTYVFQQYLKIKQSQNFDEFHFYNNNKSLEIICLSCQVGYLLYENRCIQDCDSSCKLCQIINGQSICVQCHPPINGYLKSTIKNNICLECPNNCVACSERNIQEIHAYNPHFRETKENIKNTRKCYQFQDNNNFKGMYLNSQNQILTMCNEFEFCQNKFLYKINAYCSYEDYSLNRMDDGFGLYINSLFTQIRFYYENFIAEILNQEQAQFVELQIKLIQGRAKKCIIQDNFFINSKIQEKVFSINQFHLYLYAREPISLELQGQFSIFNFSQITLQNLTFHLVDSINIYQKEFKIIITTINMNSIINITQCKFTTEDNLQMFEFQFNNFTNLIIQNVTFQNFQIINSKIFSYQFQKISVNNLEIINSLFQNSCLFSTLNNINSYTGKISIHDVIINNSEFITSSIIILISSKFISQNSTLLLQHIILINNLFIDSIVFLNPYLKNFIIDEFKINNSKFINNSIIFQTQCLILKNSQISNIIYDNSSLINNQFFQQYEFSQFSETYFFINNLSFINIIIQNYQSFINISRFEYSNILSIDLSQVRMHSIKSNTKQLDESSLQSILFYLECQICIISQIYSDRNYGVVEFQLFKSNMIQLTDIFVIQSNHINKQVLHFSKEFVDENLMPFTSFIIISFYKNILITNIKFIDCIIINKPLILIKGYDQNYMIINESIQIINSTFHNNTILLTQKYESISLLSILTNQYSNITLSKIIYQGNILNQYFQSIRLSSLTLLIAAQFGTLIHKQFNVKHIKFYFIHQKQKIKYIQSNFTQNNIILTSNILNKLRIEIITEIQLHQYFPIFSKGGNGNFICNQIYLNNILVRDSFAAQGGAFAIQTNGEGIIMIENSFFQNIGLQMLNQYYSMGGSIYIDSSQSNLNFTFINSNINNTYSYLKGGGIYIIPSFQQNLIQLINLTIQDCYAMEGNFIYYEILFLQKNTSTILLDNIKFNQTQLGYENYISKIKNQDFSFYFSSIQNILLFIKYGHITLKNLYFLNTHLQTLIQIDYGQKVIIEDILIQNCSYFNNPLIQINLLKDAKSSIIFKNVKILNILRYFQIQQVIKCDKFESLNKIINSNMQQIEQQQLICNQELFFNQKQISILSLIIINANHSYKEIILTNFKLINISCRICQKGILYIEITQSIFQQILKIKEIKIQDCICGIYGCLYLKQNNNNILNLQIQQIDDQLSKNIKYKLQFIQYNIDSAIIIQNSLFQNNVATYGGALFLNETAITIYQCQFLFNQAIQGGAIYFISSNDVKLYILETLITNNNASIAGGLFLKSSILQLTSQLKLLILDNNSTNFGNDITENPSQLSISLDGGKNLLKKQTYLSTNEELIEKILISPYSINSLQLQSYLMLPSGIAINKYSIFSKYQMKMIPYNHTLRIIALNKLNQIEKQLNNSFCTLSTQLLQISNINQDTSIKNVNLSKYEFYYNETSEDFNLDELEIYFNPLMKSDYFVRLIIQCNFILVSHSFINSKYKIITNYKQYKLYLDIQTFDCQIGEYLNMATNGCVLCDVNQDLYSLKENQFNCIIRDSTSIKNLTSSTIELRQNFWRTNNQTSKIEFCHNNQQACLGGWLPGDDSCMIGYIGALCEYCDIYNIRNQGSFSFISQLKCATCGNIIQNTLIIFFILIWLILSLYTSVNSTIQKNKEYMIKSLFKLTIFPESFHKAELAILLKLFTNYFQLISQVQSFQIQIPQILAMIQQSLGNPIKQASYSFDCFVIYFTIINVNYFRIIWMIIQILIVLQFYIFIGTIHSIINKTKFELFKIYTALIYLFIYLQPSIIESLISQLSYRNISEIKWISGNPAEIYDTNTHFIWMIYFIIPLTVLIGLIIPLKIFLKLYFSKNHLNDYQIRQTFGYLINEYKLKAYFWDLIKLITKDLIIVVLVYYQDYVAIKASLLVLLLFFYCLFQIQIKPYLSILLNQLDRNAMKICAYSIILGSCINFAQEQDQIEIIWISYFIIGYLNINFSLLFIIKILKISFKQLNVHLEKLELNFISNCPKFYSQIIKKYLFNQIQQKQNFKTHINKIRQKLLPQIRQFIYFRKMLIQHNQYGQSTKRDYFSSNDASLYFQTARQTSRGNQTIVHLNQQKIEEQLKKI